MHGAHGSSVDHDKPQVSMHGHATSIRPPAPAHQPQPAHLLLARRRLRLRQALLILGQPLLRRLGALAGRAPLAVVGRRRRLAARLGRLAARALRLGTRLGGGSGVLGGVRGAQGGIQVVLAAE